MDDKKCIKYLVGLIYFICSIGFLQPLEAQSVIDSSIHSSEPNSDDIMGTWISENDSKSKWIFSRNIAKSYYDNELLATFNYRISETSPQCGKKVQTGERLEYLELTDVADGEQECYYINGLNEETLNISPFGKSTILVFKRKPIIGTWTLIEDAKSKWAFTPDSVHQYYDGKLTKTLSYVLHSTLPECGVEWNNPDPNLKFLVLEDSINNTKDCFAVYGLNENYFTISPFEIGGIIRFKKE